MYVDGIDPFLFHDLFFNSPRAESEGTSSKEASATRVDILDGVRNFRPKQVIHPFRRSRENKDRAA